MISLRTTAAIKSTLDLLADNQLRALLTERANQLSEWLSDGLMPAIPKREQNDIDRHPNALHFLEFACFESI
jgi:hypothetical protein